MSRTKKGAKSPGYEYWSKRPLNGHSPGSIAKRITHKLERAQQDQDLIKELKDEAKEKDRC